MVAGSSIGINLNDSLTIAPEKHLEIFTYKNVRKEINRCYLIGNQYFRLTFRLTFNS